MRNFHKNVNWRGISGIFIDKSVMFTEKTVDCTKISVAFKFIISNSDIQIPVNSTDILVESTVFSVNIIDLSINIPKMPLQLTFFKVFLIL